MTNPVAARAPTRYHPQSMRWLANLIYFLVALLYLPVAIYNAMVLGKNRTGWSQRFGNVPTFDPTKKRIWIHAVSLGEVNATSKLVNTIEQQRPDVDIVFSTTTDTGYARAVQLYGRDRVFRFPLDISTVISKALNRIHPTIIVLVELELWYNFVCMSAQRDIPVLVVNGRLTERSAKRLSLLGPIARSMFRNLSWVSAQDQSIASRFIELGTSADKVEITSSLKWDTATISDNVEGADKLAQTLDIKKNKPLWVCGSTGHDEEPLLLTAYHRVIERMPNDPPQLIIVPRKPERFDEVARLIEQAGFVCKRRSLHPDGAKPFEKQASGSNKTSSQTTVILGDTMGELRKFYSLADVVFVGRSLVPMGGSDPIEVAALAKPIIVGPHMDNFRLPVQMLKDADAIRRVESEQQLADEVQKMLHDLQPMKDLGARARQVVIKNQGATLRTAEKIIRTL